MSLDSAAITGAAQRLVKVTTTTVTYEYASPSLLTKQMEKAVQLPTPERRKSFSGHPICVPKDEHVSKIPTLVNRAEAVRKTSIGSNSSAGSSSQKSSTSIPIPKKEGSEKHPHSYPSSPASPQYLWVRGSSLDKIIESPFENLPPSQPETTKVSSVLQKLKRCNSWSHSDYKILKETNT
jgi:hypothetical protein